MKNYNLYNMENKQTIISYISPNCEFSKTFNEEDIDLEDLIYCFITGLIGMDYTLDNIMNALDKTKRYLRDNYVDKDKE